MDFLKEITELRNKALERGGDLWIATRLSKLVNSTSVRQEKTAARKARLAAKGAKK